MGVVKLHYYLSPPSRLAKIAPPLLRLLPGPPEVATVALEDCALLAEQRPVRPLASLHSPSRHVMMQAC